MKGNEAGKAIFRFDGRQFDAKTGIALFSYTLGEFHFTEKVTFPTPSNGGFKNVETAAFSRALDMLALALGISYWKIFCPPKIEVAFTKLNEEQADFWNTFYEKGLGEFFYRNTIDYRGLIKFPVGVSDLQGEVEKNNVQLEDQALLLVGGGKDSIVSLELIKKTGIPFSQFVVNNDHIKEQVMTLSDASQLVVKRELDPQLFEINKRTDVYNGHVPATAIVQAIALCAGLLVGFSYSIASNEESADVGNVFYLGEEINHQWSKSSEYEVLWQEYIERFVTPEFKSFSLLRPLSEVKIIELFSQYPQYFSVFSSCNRNFTINKQTGKMPKRWCGECPKCAFVFAGLSAFLAKEKVQEIFGSTQEPVNLFAKKEVIPLYRELLGLEAAKPFECVGTPDEVKLMLYLAYVRNGHEESPVMNMFLEEFGDEVDDIIKSKEKLLAVGSMELMPEQFRTVFSSSSLLSTAYEN